MESKKPYWGLLRRRECLVLTWKARFLLLTGLLLLTLLAMRFVHPFLAVTDSKPGGVLVVEGWTTDWALEAAIAEFRAHPYDRMLVTGGPLESGGALSTYKTYAELSTASLLKLGLSSNEVQAVPAPRVRQDRTYASALVLKQWLRDHGLNPKTINVMTEGPHARRSWLLFQKALGKDQTVGIISLEPREYDPRHWWRFSSGVRAVTGEAMAYLYARFLFRPKAEF